MLPTFRTALLGSLLVTGLAAAGGCRTYIPITAWEPGKLNIGAGKHVIIASVEGRPSAREEVVVTVSEQIRGGGYFTVEDQSESGASVRVAGRSVNVEGGPALAPDHIGLWFKVHEWDGEPQDIREEERYQETVAGKIVNRVRYRDRRIYAGNAVLEFAAWGPGNRTVTAGREYTGRSQLDDRSSKGDAAIAAGRDAVAQFLDDLTPRKVTRYVMVDKSEPEQDPMIALMARGQMAEASSQLHSHAERNPNSAPAAYNLGICADALGDYDNALQWYERAISLSGGAVGWYLTARDECKARRDAAVALANR